MPWFCTSAPKKKRSSKTRVSAVGGGVGRSNRPPEDDLRSNRPTFGIILQNYTGLTPDELNVQRGQTVEIMEIDEEWSLVRDMDTNQGKIPKAYCLRLDKIEGNFNNNMALNQVTTTGTLPPQSQVINVDTLQRSGSSVNSVEVHQVSNNHSNNCNGGEGTVENSETAAQPPPTPHTPSSSSQVIYEVPRSPCRNGEGSGSGQAPTTATITNTPGGMEGEPQQPPSLPPRSANLPSVADIQRQRSHRPGYLPGCKQSPNPFSVMAAGSQVSSEQSQSFVYHQYCNGNAVSFSNAGTPAYPNRPSLIRRGSVPPNFSMATPASGSPNSAFLSRPPYVDSPPSAARTPGSAGIPLVAPSPTSARVAMTPGSPNVPLSAAVTPGYAKFAMAPGEGVTPTTNMEATTPTKWQANSTPPSNNREARKFRRHSSDVLVDSTISEDAPAAEVQHRYSKRQSQPCVTALGIQSPPRRPNRLQVRRTLSMQEPKRWGGGGGNGHSMGGAAAYATPVRSSVPIHRAASYQEAVLTHDERAFGATASLKPSELLPSPQKQQATTPGSRRSSDGKARVRSRSSRSASASDFEYVDHQDDVFLPDVKKPCGIYQCIREYKQKFKGEISLKKGELVIVLDLGRGEWAWAVNSNNKQGLIPKSVLVRYHSSLGVGTLGAGGGGIKGEEGERLRRNRAETGTQTEPDGTPGDETTAATGEEGVAGAAIGNIGTEATAERVTPRHGYPHHRPPRHRASIARGGSNSSILTTTTTDSSPPSTIPRPPASSRRRKKPASVTFDPKPQLSNGGDELNDQGTPKEWFDTLDSIDAAKCLPAITIGTSLSKLPTSEQVPPEETTIVADVTVEAKDSENSTAVATVAVVPEKNTSQEEPGEAVSQKTAESNTISEDINEGSNANPIPVPPRSIPRPSRRSSGIPQRKKASSAPQTPSEISRNRPPLSRQDAIAKDGPFPPRRGSGIPQRRKAVSLPQTPVDLTDGGREEWSRRRQSSIVTASKLASSTSSSSPHSSSDRRQSAIPMRRKSRSVPQTPVEQGTVHYHDRISGRGSLSFDKASPINSPTLESKFNMHRTRKPLLTAIKDYNPPSTAKNSLPLKKGDLLHLQPHMHYPKGWMWVWHTKRRSFGFVPKSYVAYAYDSSLSRDSRRTDSVEDAV